MHVYEIKIALINWFLEDDEETSKMVHLMIEKYDQYWGIVNEIMTNV